MECEVRYLPAWSLELGTWWAKFRACHPVTGHWADETPCEDAFWNIVSILHLSRYPLDAHKDRGSHAKSKR